MTQDKDDDLLAQVFAVGPTAAGKNDINENKEDAEIVANVRRVSNAFQDFIERSGVIETETITHEHHSESHFHVETHVESHHEVHHEVVIGGGVEVRHEEHHISIGKGASHEEEHHSIGHGASIELHEEHHEVGNGVSAISAEMHPPQGHYEEHHEEQHFGIGQGAVPHQTSHDDEESVISVRTGLSEATSVSVHSSVSQKSVQIFTDAPVIVKASSRHSDVSHNSSVVPESHHSEAAHTHDHETTISINSSKSSSSSATGSEASKDTAIEQYAFANRESEGDHHENHHHHHHHHDVHHSTNHSHDSTPIAPVKSDPHDALIEEFKLRHQRAPSEVSSVVQFAGAPPPPPAVPPPVESDNESDVVTTMKVTQYEFDSQEHHVEHHHEHHHNDNGNYSHVVQNITVHHHEEPHHHHVEESHHNGSDSHMGIGAVPHHGSDDEFKFEHVEYHGQIDHSEPTLLHYSEHQHIDLRHEPKVTAVERHDDIPPVFFHSPKIQRKVEHHHHYDHDNDHHEHHHHHELESHDELQHHHDHHEYGHHETHHVHRELIPNISGPHVREELRPANVVEEYHIPAVVKPAPVAHVSPVISHQERGLRRIDDREVLAHVVATTPVTVHSTDVHHHHHHEHHHQLEHHDHEKVYHKHDDRLEEVVSGPSVKDLRSRYEQGGDVKIHYESHYISHKNQTSVPVYVEHHQHHVEHEHKDKQHEPVVHHESTYVVQGGPAPRLPHRESKEGQVFEHHHHHGEHHQTHKHDHHLEHQQHHHHHSKHNEHHHSQHHHHHHEAPKVEIYQHHHHHKAEHQQEHEIVHHHHEHHEKEHHHHEHHQERHEQHVHQHVYQSVEEDQLPVSVLLTRYGGGSKFRRPDHMEEIKIYSRSSSVPNIHQHNGHDETHQHHHHHKHEEHHHKHEEHHHKREEHHHQHTHHQSHEKLHHHHPHHGEEHAKSRTVSQSTVSTRDNRSQSANSVHSHNRSHSSTLTHEHQNHVHAAPVISPVVVPAPVAAARSTSGEHQSLRVVKSVRAFVSEWGQKDFRPPMSPIITVPRLSSSPKSPVTYTFPEPAVRKSTVLSSVSNSTNHSHSEEHKAIQKIEQALRDDASVCIECSRRIQRPSSVSSVATTVTTTTHNSHHQEPQHNNHIGAGVQIQVHVQPQIPDVHEEFVLTPLSERRAMFEQGLNRGYSVNRKTHGELRPMVNVFTD